ncbi:hypothetical protein D623_10012414 [Myotis brandtii]|uniref:Uncharacterized protein n=1 Tax=Myotis brandtii TaxID=109478 RepID=S7NFL1_MYOBR|nr:hypothetical protein D623_10012414 [Myotis brandtii]
MLPTSPEKREEEEAPTSIETNMRCPALTGRQNPVTEAPTSIETNMRCRALTGPSEPSDCVSGCIRGAQSPERRPALDKRTVQLQDDSRDYPKGRKTP